MEDYLAMVVVVPMKAEAARTIAIHLPWNESGIHKPCDIVPSNCVQILTTVDRTGHC